MRYARRLIATLTGCVAWCVAAATIAFARPDPGGGVIVYPEGTTYTASADTSLWQFALVAAIAALMTLAVIGLIASLRHTRTARPTRMLHA